MFDHDTEERSDRRRFSRRALIVGAGQTLGFAGLGWRLFQLQVLEEGRYDPLADDNRISVQVVLPKRGRIFDRNGLVLADNEETFRVTITPALSGDVTRVLSMLRRIVPLRQEDLEAIAKRAKKQSRNTPIPIATDISFDQVAQINLFAPSLPGVRTEVAWKRKYRQGAAVGHIVGYVGSVERPSIDDTPLLRHPGIRVGKSGVEAGLEATLRGEGGTTKIEVDSRGRVVRNLEVHDPRTGSDITLSIDTNLQKRIVERLQREQRASAVVIELKTGEVVAMASVPGYDPAQIADGAEGSWQRLAAAEEKPMLDRASAGQYPPGSTFKLVTALAALHSGLVDTSERISCDGRFELADQVYRCWKRTGHGKMNLHQALRESCDVYFFELSRRLGIDAIADMARALGFGQVYNCGLAQQKAGLVPDPDWKRGRWNAGWFAGETLLAGIGQGYVLATPLQLAVMTARVATGKILTPTLVKRPHGAPPPEFPQLGLHEDKLEAVRRGMLAVVNEEGGTGSNASLGEGAAVRIAGKTGTSQVSRASSEAAHDALPWKERDHALFVAYFPADTPRFAVSTIVEHGGGGGTTAAPLAREIIQLVLEAAPVRGAALHGKDG